MSASSTTNVDTGSEWLFVYYRLPESACSQAIAEVETLFGRLSGYGCAPKLMRRPELRDGEITFMEVYGPLPVADADRLRSDLTRLLPGFPLLSSAPRHVERFLPLTNPI